MVNSTEKRRIQIQMDFVNNTHTAIATATPAQFTARRHSSVAGRDPCAARKHPASVRVEAGMAGYSTCPGALALASIHVHENARGVHIHASGNNWAWVWVSTSCYMVLLTEHGEHM
jgi:hypothetical protein